jgi:predicted RNA-binding Zn-ribbon protein involved in translation (DUF1610 family)
MEDTDVYSCPRCGNVEVPDRDLILSLIPGTDELQGWENGWGFRCPRCGTAWWKDVYDCRDHWRRYPTGYRTETTGTAKPF